MAVELVRVCPTCGAQQAPDRLRCKCGALLFGVDLVRPVPDAPDLATGSQTPSPTSHTANLDRTVHCGHEDCGQPNPAGSPRCLYCNREMPVEETAPASAPAPLPAPAQSLEPVAEAGPAASPAATQLLQLPTALRDRYRVLRLFEAQGAEADILLVDLLKSADPPDPLSAAADLGAAVPSAPAPWVAKIYRQGILPNAQVQSRIDRVDTRHRVTIFETGRSDGRAYEVMEFCAHGSLRQYMRGQPQPSGFMDEVVRELAPALEAVHEAALVHRDLKPENILLRGKEPLDLVLTDFSTSSLMDATQRFTGMARTLLYAPPEALSGVLDAKADYWSLGMVLLEMALGRHPFDGLSEAVVLHHLITRTVDVKGVADIRLRRLIQGLLLREPKRRWGASEVRRWMAHDPSLAEPVEHGVEMAFARAYAVRSERCTTAEQLAVAFARHWDAGVADLMNGQLLRWFTDVHKDQNAVRLLLGLRHEGRLTPDEQLLRFILHFAPGIPPLWRGQSIELAGLLAQASLALQGHEEAADWLEKLRQQRVLETYAAAGNAKAAEIAERWSGLTTDYEQVLAQYRQQLQTHAASTPVVSSVVLFDDAVYGQAAGARASGPSLPRMQARFLAAAYDPAWVERLRSRLLPELPALAASAPWLLEWGDLRTMRAAQLLACETLLPQLRENARLQARQEAARQQRQAELSAELQAALQANVAQIGVHARELSFIAPESFWLDDLFDEHQTLLARIRAHDATDEQWLAVRRQALRQEPILLRMRRIYERLGVRRLANQGWFRQESLTVVGILSMVAFVGWGGLGVALVLFLAAGLIAWRCLPIWHKIRDLHRLGAQLHSARSRKRGRSLDRGGRGGQNAVGPRASD